MKGFPLMNKKSILIITSVVLLLCFAVGGTLAWLTDKTVEVKNVFTYGNIDITLAESAGLDLKMVPGKTITKDPKVTVVGGSEACWLFVKIEKSDNFGTYMSYGVDDKWTALDGVDGVYYMKVAASADDQEFSVIADNEVTVLETVTKGDMDALAADATKVPTLTFTAYAVQADGFETAAAAWAKAE